MQGKRAGQGSVQGKRSPVDWENIDTVLLDMDGTLLDLNYDNHLWNWVLPRRVAALRHGEQPLTAMLITQTSAQLTSHMRTVQGTIDYYCLDYWASHTQLDMLALHREFEHLIRYRPSAQDFLHRLGQRGIRRIITTNAHRDSLRVKNDRCGISALVDACVSSHDYGQTKETQAFWHALRRDFEFDPTRTLFIDDSDPVLCSARDFGIAHLLTVLQPDLDRPPRTGLNYPAFNDFAEILPEPRP